MQDKLNITKIGVVITYILRKLEENFCRLTFIVHISFHSIVVTVSGVSILLEKGFSYRLLHLQP